MLLLGTSLSFRCSALLPVKASCNNIWCLRLQFCMKQLRLELHCLEMCADKQLKQNTLRFKNDKRSAALISKYFEHFLTLCCSESQHADLLNILLNLLPNVCVLLNATQADCERLLSRGFWVVYANNLGVLWRHNRTKMSGRTSGWPLTLKKFFFIFFENFFPKFFSEIFFRKF